MLVADPVGMTLVIPKGEDANPICSDAVTSSQSASPVTSGPARPDSAGVNASAIGFARVSMG